MWNNNDEDYDHVDAGNQERDDLGKKVFNTLAVPLLIVIAIYLCLNHLNCSKYQCCGHIESPRVSKTVQFWNTDASAALNVNFLSL